jgi:hypothetical protein
MDEWIEKFFSCCFESSESFVSFESIQKKYQFNLNNGGLNF